VGQVLYAGGEVMGVGDVYELAASERRGRVRVRVR
jgi:hypothetical protein